MQLKELPPGFRLKELDNYYLLYNNDNSLGNENFAIFDRDNEPIMYNNKQVLMLRNECHSSENPEGFYHRGSNVFLINEGKLYMPKRARDKDIFPGYHDISVSEHVKAGESYEKAALRGLYEELNQSFEKKDLKELFDKRIEYVNTQTGIKNFEWARYYAVEYNAQAINPSEETMGGGWVNINELVNNTAGFREDHIEGLKEFVESYVNNF